MTSLPARHFGFRDRGEVREGAAADLVVFDPARVRDRATYAAPHAAPDGILHVLVNGLFVVRDGEPTAERPGVVLRSEGTGKADRHTQGSKAQSLEDAKGLKAQRRGAASHKAKNPRKTNV